MFCVPSFDEMTNLTPYFNHVIPAYAGIQTASHSASQVEELYETGSEGEDFGTFVRSIVKQPVFDGLSEYLVYECVREMLVKLMGQDGAKRFYTADITVEGTRDVLDFTFHMVELSRAVTRATLDFISSSSIYHGVSERSISD